MHQEKVSTMWGHWLGLPNPHWGSIRLSLIKDIIFFGKKKIGRMKIFLFVFQTLPIRVDILRYLAASS